MRDPQELGDMIRRGLALGASKGPRALLQRARVHLADRRDPSRRAYARWLLDERRGGSDFSPVSLSLVVPLKDPEPSQLDALVASVRAQRHARWELIFVDDGSRSEIVRRRVERHVAADPRVRVLWRETSGGISKATNAGAQVAQGDALVLVDHDDVLAADVLTHFAAVFRDPRVELVYADHDELTPTGERVSPRFKPGPSPWFSLSLNYVTHPLAIRRELFARLGGLRSSFDGAQDHDLLLRAWEQAQRVVHIPVIGYHWRRGARSVAAGATAKPWAFVAGQRAAEAAARRRGLDVAELRTTAVAGVNQIVMRSPSEPREVRVILHGYRAGREAWEDAVRALPHRFRVLGVHHDRWPASDESAAAWLVLDGSTQAEPAALELLACWAAQPGVGAVGGSGGRARRRHLGFALDRQGCATPLCPGLGFGALGPQLLAAAPREVAALANGALWLRRPVDALCAELAERPVDTAGVIVASAGAWLRDEACLWHPQIAPREFSSQPWRPKRVHLHGQPGARALLEGLPGEFWAGDDDRFCPRHELLDSLGLPSATGEGQRRAASGAFGLSGEPSSAREAGA